VYRILFIVVMLLALALGLLVGTLNSELVAVDLLWLQLDWPLGLVILSAAALGLLFGLVLTWLFSVMPLRARLRRAQSISNPPGGLNNGNG
jgi:uncharacterized integral membrane protein